MEEKAACRHSHSTDHIFLTAVRPKTLVISVREKGRSWVHTENMKAATSGGLGSHPRLIFTTLWQSFSGAHMGAVKANPQRVGDDRLDTSTSLPASSYWLVQSNWSSDAKQSGNEKPNCFQPIIYQKRVYLQKMLSGWSLVRGKNRDEKILGAILFWSIRGIWIVVSSAYREQPYLSLQTFQYFKEYNAPRSQTKHEIM